MGTDFGNPNIDENDDLSAEEEEIVRDKLMFDPDFGGEISIA